MAKVELKSTGKVSVDEVLRFVQGTDTMAGFEDLTQQTMAIPFVRILQQLSPQVNKKDPAYIEGAEEGMLFNTIMKSVLGSAVNVIVLKFERIFIEWKPQRQGLVGYHSPEHAEQLVVDKTFGAWKTKDGNILTETYVYMVLIEGHEKEGIAVLSLSSSSIKVAKTWNRLMTTHILSNGKKAMPYYMVWKFATEYVSNDKGNWYRPKVEFVRYINSSQYFIAGNERKMLPPSRNLDLRQGIGEEDREEGIKKGRYLRIEGAQEEPTAEY